MSGRIEHRLKTEQTISRLLNNMPECMVEYYYNLSSKREIKTCEEYIRKVRKFLLYVNSDPIQIDWRQINETDIAKYFKHIETKIMKDGKMANTSFSFRKENYTALNSFFKYLYKKGYIPHNPVEFIDRPTKKDSVSRKFMTEDDLSKIIKTVKCGAGSSRAIARQDNWWTRDLAIILMFITTGMRKTALSEIDINDINFTTNEIRVVDKEHETHTFNMPNILTDALIDWMYQREKILQGTDVAPLFISNRLKRMSPDSISLLVKKYTIEALGEPFSPHKIRAAFANIMLEHTGNIKIVADALRHKQIETTKIYLNNDEKKVNKKTVDIMNSIFK